MGVRGHFGSREALTSYCLSRRLRYLEYLKEGYSNAEAAKLVGVRRDTANVWRNGKRRTSGRNEAPGFASGQLPPFYNNGMGMQNKGKQKNIIRSSLQLKSA